MFFSELRGFFFFVRFVNLSFLKKENNKKKKAKKQTAKKEKKKTQGKEKAGKKSQKNRQKEKKVGYFAKDSFFFTSLSSTLSVD